MPIPPHTVADVLPPFIGNPTGPARAAYRVTLAEVVQAFGTSRERRRILRGLIAYRDALRTRYGMVHAVQWLDGSFLDILRDREPRDVDVVTFYLEPERAAPLTREQEEELKILTHGPAKEAFLCDVYYVPVNECTPLELIERAVYWYGA